jgi:RNA polymerase-binding transcription factor DksA
MENSTVLREKLENQLKVVVAELSTIAIHNPLTDDWEVTLRNEEIGEPDSDLQADVAEAADEQVSTLAELENHYTAIIRALKKMDAGTYGVCEISGEAIEPERLAINPAARTCIAHREEEYRIPL